MPLSACHQRASALKCVCVNVCMYENVCVCMKSIYICICAFIALAIACKAGSTLSLQHTCKFSLTHTYKRQINNNIEIKLSLSVQLVFFFNTKQTTVRFVPCHAMPV